MNPSKKQIPMRLVSSALSVIMRYVIAGVIAVSALSSPLQAGVWDDFKEWYLLGNISGGGHYVGYKRNVDSKDRNFPLAVISDGYKMLRVYEDLPGVYLVEWAWQMTITNRSIEEVKFTLEYLLRDADLFLVASSHGPACTIAPGQTITVEQTDTLPYEKVRPVDNSNWHIKLQ